MNAGQTCQSYSGVTRHVGKWLVKFRCRGRDVNLGHYEDPELAAKVADFARYMCFGLNPGHWHHNVGKPNFLPRDGLGVPRVAIVLKLSQLGTLKPETLDRRLAEYNAIVEQNAARCAHG